MRSKAVEAEPAAEAAPAPAGSCGCVGASGASGRNSPPAPSPAATAGGAIASGAATGTNSGEAGFTIRPPCSAGEGGAKKLVVVASPVSARVTGIAFVVGCGAISVGLADPPIGEVTIGPPVGAPPPAEGGVAPELGVGACGEAPETTGEPVADGGGDEVVTSTDGAGAVLPPVEAVTVVPPDETVAEVVPPLEPVDAVATGVEAEAFTPLEPADALTEVCAAGTDAPALADEPDGVDAADGVDALTFACADATGV